MQTLIGVLATLVGLATLLSLLDRYGALDAAVDLTIERIMQFKIEKIAQAESDELYRRTRSADNVEDYVTLLRQLGVTEVGATFKLALETVTVTDEDGTEEDVEILEDSIEESEPDGITVRAAKRRFNAAAKQLGFKLSWKEPTGWLIARAVASTPEVTTEESAPTEGAPASAPVVTAPASAPAQTASQAAGNGGRRVVRRK